MMHIWGVFEGCKSPHCSKWLNYRGADYNSHLWHHPSTSPAVIMWKVVGQHLVSMNAIPNNFTTRTRQKVWCDRGMMSSKWLNDRGADYNSHFWHHLSTSPVVIMWKVVGQHPISLNMIPNHFTTGTGQKLWCDRGMKSSKWLKYRGANCNNHFWHHLPTSLVVIMW